MATDISVQHFVLLYIWAAMFFHRHPYIKVTKVTFDSRTIGYVVVVTALIGYTVAIPHHWPTR